MTGCVSPSFCLPVSAETHAVSCQQQDKPCWKPAPTGSLEPGSTGSKIQSRGELRGRSGCPEVTAIPFQLNRFLWSHSWSPKLPFSGPLLVTLLPKISPRVYLDKVGFKPQWNILENFRKICSAAFEGCKRGNNLTASKRELVLYVHTFKEDEL